MPLSDIPDMDWGRIQNAVLWVENHTRGTNQRLPGEGSPVPYQFRRFRLTEVLQEGSSAAAVHLRWDGDAAFVEGEAMVVWDLVDNYVGAIGDEGWAIHPHDLDRWEIVELRQAGGDGGNGGPFWATLAGTLSTGSSATADIIDETETPTGESVTAHDRLLATAQTISSGTKVLVEWIQSESRWYVTAAECE